MPVLKRGDQIPIDPDQVSGSRLHREARLDASADLNRQISDDVASLLLSESVMPVSFQ